MKQPQLVGSVAMTMTGFPVVVMGGGPSLPMQLATLRHDVVAWISANEHGARYRQADYIVCVDQVHCETKESMEKRLRPFRVPIVSPLQWADYRLPEWELQCNSGLVSVFLAYLLGACPIIVAGVDCYQGGTYWHDASAASVSNGRPESFFLDRAAELRDAMPGAVVRPMGGVLTRLWTPYNPAEYFDPFGYRVPEKVQQAAVQLAQQPFRARQGFNWRGREHIPTGGRLWLTEAEAAPLLDQRLVRPWG